MTLPPLDTIIKVALVCLVIVVIAETFNYMVWLWVR